MASQGKPTVLQTLKGVPAELLIAPDSFKGTFTSAEVAAALARGALRSGLGAQQLPVADGGEGTLAALIAPLGLTLEQRAVADPLGRAVTAEFGLSERVAVVETAAASGLQRVAEEERDPILASTYGTGELIAAAVSAGVPHVYVGVGGSATSDGGEGALQALGELDPKVLQHMKVTVLCDVKTAFEDAARVFGPQKGADAAQVEVLSERLALQAASMRRDPRGVPMSGAAGGLAGALWAQHGAELVAGAPFLLGAVGYDERMHSALAVITGEGRLDHQSLLGKLVSEVATRARQAGVPCHAVVGSNALPPFDARILDLQLILEATTIDEIEAAGEAIAGAIQADRSRGR